MNEESYNPAIRLLCINRSRDLHGWWAMDDLSAPYWRLYWHEAPGAYAVYAGRRAVFDPDHVFLIPPNTAFSGRCPGHTRQFFIHFLAGGPYADVPPEIYSCPLGAELRVQLLLRSAEAADQQRQPGTNDYGPEGAPPLPVRVRALAGLRLILLALEGALPPELIQEKRYDPRLGAVLELLEAGAKPRSNRELARRIHLSESAFTRLFRSEMGTSPQAYQRKRRIEEACRLLHHTDWPISRIAQGLYFHDRYHFSRVFKSERGMGPAEFRRLFPFAPRGDG